MRMVCLEHPVATTHHTTTSGPSTITILRHLRHHAHHSISGAIPSPTGEIDWSLPHIISVPTLAPSSTKHWTPLVCPTTFHPLCEPRFMNLDKLFGFLSKSSS
mmetsp:Transcript_13002/g.18630  ORF Transcript_13002/g.18630 Transcript_13002/m.18630 type:complete len:103 (-) Transcript_13002:794-1102(-)